MTIGGGRSITYNVANKPTGIVDDSPSHSGTVDFAYGADGNRVLQVASGSTSSSRTIYVGLGNTGKSLYERTTIGSTSIHTFFISAGAAHGGSAFAVRVLDDQGTVIGKNYFNFDHLGSTSAISDQMGHVASVASGGPAAGVLGYDPWGARRNPDGQAVTDPTTFQVAPGSREFTGQETIPSIELVNMNGRIYDPVVGRFLSPDPNVQTSDDLQSYNRYSYVLNNPLRYSDPTGYFSIGSVGSWLGSNAPGIFIALGGIAICASTGGGGCVVAGIVSSVLSASVARAEGASWTQVGTSLLIGAIAGNMGAAAGSMIGSELGAKAGSAADFAASEIGGTIGGAIGGAMSTVLPGSGGLGRNILLGAGQGAVWAAVGWGMKNRTSLTRADEADRGAGGSGESVVEEHAREDAAGLAAADASSATTGAEAARELDALLAQETGGHTVSDDELIADSKGDVSSAQKGSVKSADKLNGLAPGFREQAIRVVNRMVDEGYDVRVVWGRRTFDENQQLVEEGLASPTSKHLTGNAVDLIDRSDPYPDDRNNKYYLDLRDAVAKESLVWGGYCWGNCIENRWDPTHFEVAKQ